MRIERIDVLLVEDDEAIRETLAEVLAEEGYLVATAQHGAQALEKLSQGLRPRLILLDLMMPVMDGWQLLRCLHGAKELGDIPVIVVSAARDRVPEGARNYLHKPLDLETLLAAVEGQCPHAPHPCETGPQATRPSARPVLEQAAGGR